MSQRGHDQPNYYSTTTRDRFWASTHADSTVTAAVGYLTGDAALTASSENGSWIKYHRFTGQSTFAVGMKFRCSGYPAADKAILGVVDPFGAVHVSLVLKTDGTLATYRGNISSLFKQSSSAIPLNTWLDIGLKGVVSGSGSVEAWLGTSGILASWDRFVPLATAVNTSGGSGDEWMGIYVGSTNTTRTCHIYWRDGNEGNGGQNDLSPGYLVRMLAPDAAGGLTAWAANVGTLPDALDDADADDDATFAASTAVHAAYSVDMETLPATRAIYACELVALVRNGSGSTKAYESVVVCNRDSSTERTAFVRAEQAVSDAAWVGVYECFPVNPYTNDTWLRDEVNQTEWGGRTAA